MYLHNLISLQHPRCTRTSSVVTLMRPPASSCLWKLQIFENRSFWHASPHLRNKLPVSLCPPCDNQYFHLHPLHCHHPSHLHSFTPSYKNIFPKKNSTIDSYTHQPGYFSDRNLAVLVSYLLNSQQFLFSFSFHLFVARDAFVRTNRRAINCHDAHPSVSLFVCLVRACIVIIGAFWCGSNFLVG